MRSVFLQIALLALAVATISSAQDSHFPTQGTADSRTRMPDDEGTVGRGSKPCSQTEHEAWLADITHWRMNVVFVLATMVPGTICPP